MNKREDLTKGSITKHIKQIALPAAIGFIFQTLYNIIDTFFAGKISVDALSAMTVSMPIFFIIISLGSGIGIGMNTIVGNYLGENKKKEAQKFTAQGILFVIIASILLMILGFIFLEPILSLLGVSSSVFNLTLDYTYILFIGVPFMLSINLLNSILIVRGDSKTFRNLVLIGVVANIILDPLFMNGFLFIPAMGLKGIALATILINFIKFIVLLLIILKDDFFNKIKLIYFRLSLNKFKKIFKFSIPASLSNIIMSISSVILIYFLTPFGNEAVAAIGVSTRVEQIIYTPLIGLIMALISIVSQNNGARHIFRIKETVRKVFKFSFVFIGILSILIFIFAKYLVILFIKDPLVVEIGVNFIRITIFVLISEVVYMISAYTLQAFKKPGFLLWTSFLKRIFFLFVVGYILINLLGYNLYSIFWANLVISFIFGVYAFIYMKNHISYKHKKFLEESV